MMRFLLALAISLFSTAAFAHTGVGEASGFMHGFMHPVSGLDHILAMVAVGVLAFVIGGRALYALPLSFMCAMIVGGFFGMTGLEMPLIEVGIGASIIVIAGLAALGYSWPVWIYGLIVGFFAIFHGFAHGAEMPVDASGYEYAAGFFLATGLLHMTGIVGAMASAKLPGNAGRTVARVGAAVMALAGIGVLTGNL